MRTYIGNLTKDAKLKSAQPLVREGKIISGSKGAWKEGPFNETKEVIVGYYHILAEDLDDAIAIAKGNPEFEYGTTARIEVRPIKTKEESTGFVYPKTAETALISAGQVHRNGRLPETSDQEGQFQHVWEPNYDLVQWFEDRLR